MAANKVITLGPVAMAASTATNLFSPPTTTGGTGVPEQTTNTYYIIRHIRIVNTSAGAVTVSLFKSTTGAATAGKEIIASATSVGANSFIEWFGLLRLDSGDTNKFIVGGGSTALTIEAEGEMGIS